MGNLGVGFLKSAMEGDEVPLAESFLLVQLYLQYPTKWNIRYETVQDLQISDL